MDLDRHCLPSIRCVSGDDRHSTESHDRPAPRRGEPHDQHLRSRRLAATSAGIALAHARCSPRQRRRVGDGAEFPDGPITILGADPGGSTDLIARAAADGASEDLGVAVTVENKPGANGALSLEQLANENADGQTLAIFNGSLAYITPFAVAEDEAVSIEDYDVITGLSLDDYVLGPPPTGFATVEDPAAAAARSRSAPPASAPAASSQELLFAQADIEATSVPSTAARLP